MIHDFSSNLLRIQIDLIVNVMETKEFSAGDVIIQQGSIGDYFYVLEEGSCDIFKDGVLVLQCSQGMGFGELALMYDAPRAATVKATSAVKVSFISFDWFCTH